MTEDKLAMEDMSMGELLASMPERILSGTIVQARVLGKNADGVLVDIGLKMEGLIPKAEFPQFDTGPLPFKEGETISVLVRRIEGHDQHHKISWKAARELGSWDKLIAAHQGQTPVEGTITRKVKGGYVVDIGADAFLPGSQLDLRPRHDGDAWVGKKFSFVITELDRAKSNVVVSRRKLLERDRQKQRETTLSTIAEGQTVAGTVTSTTAFGAFIDIGGIEGLLHISDLAWKRPDKPEHVLKVGDTIQVKVLKHDASTHRISLGLKQLLPHPWESVKANYAVGSTITGKVTSLTTFGAFVELEPGVEGLIHISEMSWKERLAKPQDILKVGQEVSAKVLLVDPAKEKLSLSLKRMGQSPWDLVKKNHPIGSRVKGPVTHVTNFGAFVMLPEGVEGLLHVSDMSWIQKVQAPTDVVKVGEEVEVVVMDIKAEAEKVTLSLKAAQPDPLSTKRVGDAVTGRVTSASDVGITVDLGQGLEGFVRRQEMAADAERNPIKPAVGEEITAKILRVDVRERKIDLSVRKYDREEERQMMKRYGGQNQQPLTLGQVLVDPSAEGE